MTIIDAMMGQLTRRVPTRIPDGEGGSLTRWRDGDTFRGAVSAHRSTRAREGEHDVTENTFHLTTLTDVPDFSFGDVFRDATGRTYRVTSDAREFPLVMSVHYKRYTVERWVEP